MVTEAELEKLILLNLEEHIQVERTKRCVCGWRPDYKSSSHGLFPEYAQHREHLAKEIAKSVRWA